MTRTTACFLAAALALGVVATAGAQTQVLDASEPVAIQSTTAVVIDTVSVTTAGTRDVALAAHVFVEGLQFNGGGYEFRLERVTPSVSVVGTVNWAPAVALNASLAGDTVAITGFDEGVATPATYRLVGQKTSAGAANLVVNARGIDAIDRVAGTVISGNRAAASVAVSASNNTPIHTLQVDVPLPSDVLLWGHVTITTPGGTDGIYGISICDGAGDSVATEAWIPGAGTAETNVVSLVGLDLDVAGDTSYSICAARAGNMPIATATFRSLQALRSTSTIHGSQGIPGDAPPVTSTAYSAVWIIDAPTTHPDGMAIFVQTSPFAAGYQNLLYEFGIHRGSCAGARLGSAGWRPGLSPNAEQSSDPLLVTGFDPAPGEPQSYAFCARKANAAAPDLIFYGIKMAAAPLPAPEPGSAGAAIAVFAALYAIARSRRTAAVSAPSGRARPR